MTDKTVPNQSELKAGTGFMPSLTEALKKYQALGYVDNLVPELDHFSFDSGKVKIYPHELEVEKVLRFENTSDPDDQSIMYVLSAPSKNMKGIYVDSYGIYHDELSKKMLQALSHQQM